VSYVIDLSVNMVADPIRPPLSAGIALGSLRTPEEEPLPLKPDELPAFQAEVEAFAQRCGLNFTQPPFILSDELDPQSFAAQIAETMYNFTRTEGPLLSLLWREFTKDSTPATEGLRATGEAIAADYDRGIGAGRSNAFHNPQHVAEVMLGVHALLLLAGQGENKVPPETRLTLMMAALVQDWHHDGTTNAGLPFRLENRALMRARPYFVAGKLEPALIRKIDLLVRATDTAGPHEFARAALDWHIARLTTGDENLPPPEVPPGYEALAPLLDVEEAETAEMSAQLRDADVLTQAGLTPDYAMLQNARLQDEWALPITPEEYREFLNVVLGRERLPTDEAQPQPYEDEGRIVGFASPDGQFFNSNIPLVAAGVLSHQEEVVAEVAAAEAVVEEQGIDFSMLSEATETAAAELPPLYPPEEIEALRKTLHESGYFDSPPFSLTAKAGDKALPSVTPVKFSLTETTTDSIMRLHGVAGPVVSAVTAQVFSVVGLDPKSPLIKAAMGIAREIDLGHGVGTKDDIAGGEPNPYHNKNHTLDLLLLSHLLGLRASQRGSTASTAFPWGLLLLAALICHWHHTGGGNKVDGQYRNFYLQDRALDFAMPHLESMSTDLVMALQALVRATDPRDPLIFSRAAYNFHIGLGPEPEVPVGCEPLARLLSDPALTTVATRLNDAIYAPFVGLNPAYSARAMVQMGREIGVPIDFEFVRKNLILPMLSRPLLPGETPPQALMLAHNRVASFTSAEAQALFNPSLHILLLAK